MRLDGEDRAVGFGLGVRLVGLSELAEGHVVQVEEVGGGVPGAGGELPPEPGGVLAGGQLQDAAEHAVAVRLQQAQGQEGGHLVQGAGVPGTTSEGSAQIKPMALPRAKVPNHITAKLLAATECERGERDNAPRTRQQEASAGASPHAEEPPWTHLPSIPGALSVGGASDVAVPLPRLSSSDTGPSTIAAVALEGCTKETTASR